MKNFNIHEALCRLFPDAPTGSWRLEQSSDTNWEIVIAEWNLPDPHPTQEEIDAVYDTISADRAIAQIEEKYDKKMKDVQFGMIAALLADGSGEDINSAALRITWANLQDAKQAEILAALGV